jgi:short subunit dehydrogenase-like uncharacterized protein
MHRFLVYGANGYTGDLIAREAVRRGLQPVVAGRNAAAINRLASELNCEARIADLGDPASLARMLTGIDAVLHCAGPFSSTAAPMMRACFAAGTHYLDVTGEIDVFEAAKTLDADARKAGVILCPGVGFDVVATDCVAAVLHEALPDATYLALGFDSRSGISAGTMRSTIEGLPRGGRIRSSGRLVTVEHAFRVRDIDFGDGAKQATTIPWGDVSTAFHTTGIPNIEVYVPMPQRQLAALRRLKYVMPLMRLGPVQSFLKARASARTVGPDQEARTRLPTFVWGEVQAPSGDLVTARIRVGNLYEFTVHSALGVLERLLASPAAAGYRTPSQVVGARFIESLPDSTPIVMTRGRAWEPRHP